MKIVRFNRKYWSVNKELLIRLWLMTHFRNDKEVAQHTENYKGFPNTLHTCSGQKNPFSSIKDDYMWYKVIHEELLLKFLILSIAILLTQAPLAYRWPYRLKKQDENNLQ